MMAAETWIGWLRISPDRTWRQVVQGDSQDACERALERMLASITARTVDTYVGLLGNHPARKDHR